MPKCHCYILFSKKLNRYYIGSTKDLIESRIEKHNSGFYGKKSFSASANDWTLFLLIEAQDYPHAVRLERKIKSMKSSKYIQNLKSYPELVDKIIAETSTEN